MTVLLLWIVRILILLLIIRFVVGLFTGKGRQRHPAQQAKKPRARVGGKLVQDPQCGTYVPQDKAIVVTAHGATQYFCSAKCRDEWTSRA